APQYWASILPTVVAVTCSAPFAIVAVGWLRLSGAAYVNVPPMGSLPSALSKLAMIGLSGADVLNGQPRGGGIALPPAPPLPVMNPAAPATPVGGGRPPARTPPHPPRAT